MDQTAPPSGAQPYTHPEPWPTEQWRSPLIGVALAVLTLPAAASVLVGLLVLAVQGRASWLLVALSALVTTAIGVLASTVAFRRRPRRPVRLLAAVAAAWGVLTLVTGVVVGLELDSSERVALAVLLVVGGAWTILFGLVLGLAWWLLPADASESRTGDDGPGDRGPHERTTTPAGDRAARAADTGATAGGVAATTAAAGTAGTTAGEAAGHAPGATSPGPVASDLPPAHATSGEQAPGTADDPALAEWPEWGSRPGARTASPAGGEAGTGPVPAGVDVPVPGVMAAPAAPVQAPAQAAPAPADPPQAPPAELAPARPAGRTASSATPPPSSVDDTMVVEGPIIDDEDDLDAPPAPTRRSVSSAPVRGRRGDAARRSSGRPPEAGPPTQRLPHVDR